MSPDPKYSSLKRERNSSLFFSSATAKGTEYSSDTFFITCVKCVTITKRLTSGSAQSNLLSEKTGVFVANNVAMAKQQIALTAAPFLVWLWQISFS
jgi:hypothetical protein